MLSIRYDFVGDKIEVSRLEKHLLKIFNAHTSVNYDFYTANYRFNVKITMFYDTLSYHVSSLLVNLNDQKNINIIDHILFKDNVLFEDLYDKHYTYNTDLNLITISRIINAIKYIFNIDKIKIFI
jgi:hypothetical protein